MNRIDEAKLERFLGRARPLQGGLTPAATSAQSRFGLVIHGARPDLVAAQRGGGAGVGLGWVGDRRVAPTVGRRQRLRHAVRRRRRAARLPRPRALCASRWSGPGSSPGAPAGSTPTRSSATAGSSPPSGRPGLEAWACLAHTSLPGWFSEDERGFLDDGMARRVWPAHVDLVAEAFGDLVDGWVTFHEPVRYALDAWLLANLPPGRRDGDDAQTGLRNLLAADAEAARLLQVSGGAGGVVATGCRRCSRSELDAARPGRRRRRPNGLLWDTWRDARRTTTGSACRAATPWASAPTGRSTRGPGRRRPTRPGVVGVA